MYEKKKKAVVPRLRFPEFRDAGEWEVKRLGNEEISQFIRDRILPESIPIGHYVSTANLLPDFGCLAAEPETPPPNNAVAYREGDILISNIRPYLKKVWLPTDPVARPMMCWWFVQDLKISCQRTLAICLCLISLLRM